jgi:hypothetical protein
MTPLEIKELFTRWRPWIRKTIYEALDKAGKPPGITPQDLESWALSGLVEAAEDARRAFVAEAFYIPHTVGLRLQDAFRSIQVGAVTTKKVNRPDGTVGRFEYAISADIGALQGSAFQSPEEGDGPELSTTRHLKAFEQRVRRDATEHYAMHGRNAGFTTAADSRLDLDEAISRIQDPYDWLVVHTHRMLMNPAPEGRTPEEKRWVREWLVPTLKRFQRSPRNLTVYMFTDVIPREEVLERLNRGAKTVMQYCRVKT